MAQVYTRLLGRLDGLTPSNGVTLFTAPEGYVTVLRDLVVTAAGTTQADQMIQVVSGSGHSYILWRWRLSDWEVLHVQLRQVIPPTNRVILYLTGAPWTVWATGYQFVDA